MKNFAVTVLCLLVLVAVVNGDNYPHQKLRSLVRHRMRTPGECSSGLCGFLVDENEDCYCHALPICPAGKVAQEGSDGQLYCTSQAASDVVRCPSGYKPMKLSEFAIKYGGENGDGNIVLKTASEFEDAASRLVCMSNTESRCSVSNHQIAGVTCPCHMELRCKSGFKQSVGEDATGLHLVCSAGATLATCPDTGVKPRKLDDAEFNAVFVSTKDHCTADEAVKTHRFVCPVPQPCPQPNVESMLAAAESFLCGPVYVSQDASKREEYNAALSRFLVRVPHYNDQSTTAAQRYCVQQCWGMFSRMNECKRIREKIDAGKMKRTQFPLGCRYANDAINGVEHERFKFGKGVTVGTSPQIGALCQGMFTRGVASKWNEMGEKQIKSLADFLVKNFAEIRQSVDANKITINTATMDQLKAFRGKPCQSVCVNVFGTEAERMPVSNVKECAERCLTRRH